jgi:hypothetical protein
MLRLSHGSALFAAASIAIAALPTLAQDQRSDDTVARQAQSMTGKIDSWYVVSLQEHRGTTKTRAHFVVYGKEAAAQKIVDHVNGGDPRNRHWFYDVYPTQAAAQKRGVQSRRRA